MNLLKRIINIIIVISLIFLIILMYLTLYGCSSSRDKNMQPIAVLILPDIAYVGELVTLDMTQSTDDVKVIGTSFAIDNYYAITISFTSVMAPKYSFDTEEYHVVIGYAHDEYHWLGVDKDSIFIIKK